MIRMVHAVALAFLALMTGTPISLLGYALLAAMVIVADQMIVWPLWWAAGRTGPGPFPGAYTAHRLRRRFR
jgi:hypothetical protein